MTRATAVIFTDGRAALVAAGQKTQTRRIADNGRRKFMPDVCPYGKPGDLLWVKEGFAFSFDTRILFRSDRPLPRSYASETHRVVYRDGYLGSHDWWRLTDNPFASWETDDWVGSYGVPTKINGHAIMACSVPWKSPRFMPRWASRTTLEITSTILERHTTISHDDAVAEGFPSAEAFEAAWREMHPRANELRWAITFRKVGT